MGAMKGTLVSWIILLTASMAASQTAINGGFSAWSEWNTASVPCPSPCGVAAIKVVRRSRVCDSPAPANGGQDCSGDRRQEKKVNCRLQECQNPGPCDVRYSSIRNDHTMCGQDRAGSSPVILTEQQEQDLVDSHNNFRAQQISLGAVGLMQVAWDEEIAVIAAKWARQCISGHDAPSQRSVPTLPGVGIGQNVAAGFGDFQSVMNAWYDEINNFQFGVGSTGGQIAHYTQIVNEHVSRIGCGQAVCMESGQPRNYFVCNYARGQRQGLKPYCSSADTSTTCSSCLSTTSQGLCDCGGKVCMNNGDLNQATCQCSCLSSYYTGPSCETFTCPASDPAFCTMPSNCANFANYVALCPYSCQTCPTSCSKACQNGGTLNTIPCICHCTPDFTGDQCQLTITDGAFSQWSEWNTATAPCPSICGSSELKEVSRTRTCDNPAPANGGRDCVGDRNQTRLDNCGLSPCTGVVNGVWGAWNVVDNPPCSIACGSRNDVFLTRTRQCNNPAPSNGGQPCPGSDTDRPQKNCTFPPCPGLVNGVWGAWNVVDNPPCSITCGSRNDVFLTRTRQCNNPAPSNGGQPCPGSDTDRPQKNCTFPPCPGVTFSVALQDVSVRVGNLATLQLVLSQNVDTWAWYKDGNIVTNTTNVLTYNSGPYHYLTIFSSSTSDAGRYSFQTPGLAGFANLTVTVSPGLVNGVWGAWNVVDNPPCSITCGSRNDVFLTRTRQCNNPAPSNGGQPCPGSDTDRPQKNCTFPPCPVLVIVVPMAPNVPTIGGFAEFSVELNQDNVQNGVWYKDGVRLVNSTKTLITVNGRTQRLVVNNIEAADTGTYSYTVGGLNSSSLLTIQGVTGWDQWTEWSGQLACSASCGGGTRPQFRSRTCVNRPLGCPGEQFEVRDQVCNSHLCAVNGEWGAWNVVNNPPCNITCGSRDDVFLTRTRQCNNPAPSSGGQPCPGSDTDRPQKNCTFPPCTVNGVWGAWNIVNNPPCIITCGSRDDVFLTRTRQCNIPAPSNGGQPCPGSDTDRPQKNCTFPPCPVNGEWGAWNVVDNPPCSITCGSREDVFLTRTRQCNNPAPSNGGQPCPGSDTDRPQKNCTFPPCPDRPQKNCNFPPCPVNGNWGAWTVVSNPSCQITCGTRRGLFRERSRQCDSPVPRNGGQPCSGPSTERLEINCTFPACPSPTQDLCSDTQRSSGVGYRYHPTDCDKYIQCYYNPNGTVLGVYRSCPFGFYWDQRTLRCDKPWKVTCPIERCSDKCTANYGLSGSCRSYWQCSEGLSVAKCCMSGFMYEEGQGCIPNFFCRDTCPTACIDTDVCNKRPDWSGDQASYNISIGLLGWLRARCISGSYFDITACGCSPLNSSCRADYNIAFNDSNFLNNARAAWLRDDNVIVANGVATFRSDSNFFANITKSTSTLNCPVIIKFRYRETTTVSGRRVLVSTSDCKKSNSLVIAIDNDFITFEVTSWYGNTVKLPMFTKGYPRTSWKTVTFMYNGYEMMASIESDRVKYSAGVEASDSTIMECGLVIGTDGMTNTPRFIGEMDMFTVYRCDPGNVI